MAAATLADPSAQAGSDSLALPLLALLVAGIILSYAGVRLWRLHERRRLDALWLQRDVTWEAAVSKIETKQAPRASKSRLERQKIDVG